MLVIPVKRNMKAEERKRYLRHEYETEKKGLTAFYKECGYPKEGLNTFLINSLKGFEEFLKEDKLL